MNTAHFEIRPDMTQLAKGFELHLGYNSQTVSQYVNNYEFLLHIESYIDKKDKKIIQIHWLVVNGDQEVKVKCHFDERYFIRFHYKHLKIRSHGENHVSNRYPDGDCHSLSDLPMQGEGQAKHAELMEADIPHQ